MHEDVLTVDGLQKKKKSIDLDSTSFYKSETVLLIEGLERLLLFHL